MNDEYLWQKSGEDPEIAQLENALAVYRYRGTDPPALPVAIVPSQVRRLRFIAAFATAAFASIVIGAFVWFQVADRSDDDVTFIYHPTTESGESAPVEPKQPQPVEPVKQPVRRGRPEIQIAKVPATRKHASKSRSPKSGVVALTDEERYAYDRLMLALSITSSKLNIVKNSINGVAEPENDTTKNNR